VSTSLSECCDGIGSCWSADANQARRMTPARMHFEVNSLPAKLDDVQCRLADLAGHHCLMSNEQMLPAVHAMNRQGAAAAPACL